LYGEKSVETNEEIVIWDRSNRGRNRGGFCRMDWKKDVTRQKKSDSPKRRVFIGAGDNRVKGFERGFK